MLKIPDQILAKLPKSTVIYDAPKLIFLKTDSGYVTKIEVLGETSRSWLYGDRWSIGEYSLLDLDGQLATPGFSLVARQGTSYLTTPVVARDAKADEPRVSRDLGDGVVDNLLGSRIVWLTDGCLRNPWKHPIGLVER